MLAWIGAVASLLGAVCALWKFSRTDAFAVLSDLIGAGGGGSKPGEFAKRIDDCTVELERVTNTTIRTQGEVAASEQSVSEARKQVQDALAMLRGAGRGAGH